MSTIEDSPFEIKQNEKFGRYLVAKRDLRAGEMVFKEAPLIVYSRFSETFKSDTLFTCISCYRVMKKEYAVRCHNCNWSFCSRACTFDAMHSNLECPVLRENNLHEKPKSLHFLFLLRILQLKEKDKAKWDEIINLSSFISKEDKNYNTFLNDKSVLAKDFFQRFCNMTVEISLIQQLMKIMKVNEFTCVHFSGDEPPIKKYSWTMYATCCLVSHSCQPNMEWFWHPGEDEARCTGALYTLQDIPAGMMVTTAYTEKRSLEGTPLRRPHLMTDLRFWCQCERCDDPTELGTYFSAIKCQNCDDGWLLPDTKSEDKDFKCEKCPFSLDVVEVDRIQNSFREEFVASSNQSTGSARSTNLDSLILSATTEYGLHPGHHLVFEASEKWLSLQSHTILLETTPRSTTLYQKIIKRAEQALKIYNLFGNLERRAACEMEIGMAMSRYYFKTRDYLVICEDITDLDNKIEILQKIVEHFQRGIHPADPRTFDAKTRASLAESKRRFSLWRYRLTECCRSQSKKFSL